MGSGVRDAVRVLQTSWTLIARQGWVQRPHDLGFPVPSPRERGWTLDEAISSAGKGGVPAEHARRAVRRVIGTNSIPAWNDHPFRTQREVLDILSRTIALLGGRPPLRGGWSVGGVQ